MESVCGTVAGIDVHKKTVVVVVLQSVQPDQDYASAIFGTTRFGLEGLVTFLREHGVTYVAMESTAQYEASLVDDFRSRRHRAALGPYRDE
jgi:transposase